MRLKILASSSGGNCGLVETLSGHKILIDAGLSFRKLEALLADEGVKPEEIALILLTHEHSDHVAGISGFGALRTPVYTTRGTAGAVGERMAAWQIVPAQARWEVLGLRLESFPVPHDAAEPVGFVLEDADERLVWALDMGHLTAANKKILQSATTLVIESNYCPKLLDADKKRPFALKQRIKGRHGHLSNDDTFNFLTQERSLLWQKIYLAHLSRQCNDAEQLAARYEPTGLPLEVVCPHQAVLV